MKTLLAAKPIAAVTTFGCVAVLAAAVQMAVAQGNGEAGGRLLALQASTDNASDAPPAIDVIQVAATEAAKESNDPFYGLTVAESEVAATTDDPFSDQTVSETATQPVELTLSAEERARQAQQQDQRAQQEIDRRIDRAISDLRFTDSKARDWMEERTEAALRTNIDEIDWQDVPLEEIVREYGRPMKINITVDRVALEEIGLGPDAPVSVGLKNVTFDAVLRRVLEPLGLTYLVQEDGLLITTQEKADTILETRVYPWASNRLAEVLPKVVAPHTWDVNGGGASIVNYGDRYIIRQTYAVHAEINRLLLELRRQEKDKE